MPFRINAEGSAWTAGAAMKPNGSMVSASCDNGRRL